MAKPGIRARLAWEERWTEPSAADLWAPHKEQHQKFLPAFVDRCQQYEGVEPRIAWHGEAWKWSFELVMPSHDLGGKEAEQPAFAYVVPRPETPEVAIPLAPAFLEAVPMRRLNRYIRDGIKSARQTVDSYWGLWNPTASTELDHLMDLVKRKHKWLTAPAK